MNVCVQHWWNDADRESCSKQRKLVPVPPWPPQTPHGLTWDWTQACVASSWWLTAWAMAQEACELLLCCPMTVGEVPETSYSFYLSFPAHTRIVPQIMIDCSSTHQHASCTLHNNFADYGLSQYSNVCGTGNLHASQNRWSWTWSGMNELCFKACATLFCAVQCQEKQHWILSSHMFKLYSVQQYYWMICASVFVLINSVHFTMYSVFKLMHSCKWLCMPVGEWYRCIEVHNGLCI